MLRSLKKALALSVVIAMMLSTVVAFAAVPADVKGTKYETAASALGILKIMVGDDKGNFNPDADVTRAEIAKVIVAATGIQNVVPGATKFTDVPASHWASGYVNFAAGQGIVKGTSDTTFDPEGKVTFEQAVTMIMRALGYEPAAASKGGYPVGYLTLATQYEVTDGVSGTVGQPAKRSAIAQMIYNALDVPMMIQVGYGTDVKYVESGTDDTDKEMLLTKKLKLNVWTDVHITDIDDVEKTITTEADNPYKAGTTKADDWDDEHDEYNEGTYDVVGDITLAAFEDQTVTLWANEDDEVINIVSDKDSEVVYGYIEKINGDGSADISQKQMDDDLDTISFVGNKKDYTVTTDDLTYYYNPNDKDVKKALDPNDDHTVAFLADPVHQDPNTSIGELPYDSFAKAVVQDNKVTSITILWDKDSDIDAKGIISKVDKDTITYYKDDKDDETDYDDFSADDVKKVVVIIDGQAANFSDLKAGMYFAASDIGGDTEQYIIYASTKTAKGKLGSYTYDDDAAQVKVADKWYKLANDFYYSETDDDFDEEAALNDDNNDINTTVSDIFDDLFDQDVTVVLNGAGRVVYFSGKSNYSSFYGLALENEEDDQLRVGFVKEGNYSEKTYTVSADLKIYDPNGTSIGGNNPNADSVETDPKAGLYNLADKGAYKFELNTDGKIEKMTALKASDKKTVSSFKTDEIKTTTGNIDVDKSVFLDVEKKDYLDPNSPSSAQVKDNSDEIEALDWKVVSASEDSRVENAVTFYGFYDKNAGDDVYRIVAFTHATDDLGALPVLGYVTEAPYNTTDDKVVTVNTGDKVSTIKVDKDDYTSVRSKGLILIKKTGNDTATLEENASYYYVSLSQFKTLLDGKDKTVGNTVYSYFMDALCDLYPDHKTEPASDDITVVGSGIAYENKSGLSFYRTETNGDAYLVGDTQSEIDGFIGSDVDTDSIKFASNAIVYQEQDNSDVVKSSTGSIGKGDKVYYIAVDGEIVFALFIDKGDL